MLNVFRGLFIAMTVALFMATGCAGGEGTRPTGQVVDDASITSRVKAALFGDEVTSGFQIGVDTYQGQVQLNGFVDSQEEKDRAGEIARDVQGVERVINNLEVKTN